MTSWLITGGAGSFGQAFVRYLLSDPATARVVILSRDEAKHAAMGAELNDPRLRFFVGTVCDSERLELAMRGIDHVVHAAAMKRVETCEDNPEEAYQVNITGTSKVARACMHAGVKRAVFLSTDKAAVPNTHYGATKMAAERLWCRWNVYTAGKDTRYAATRYGNVLGSRGSVLPLFHAQALNGGPLTVTDPAMTRFWMTMDQAVALVALAFREMRGGEVFVPKIGGCTMADFAAELFPGVPVKSVGIRPGEKMHETLVGEDEIRTTYDHGTHYTIEPHRTWEDAMPARGMKVGARFRYRSDTQRILPGDLAEMVR